MKHFIYLNTDILNSYLSQINDGLINSTQTEVTDEVATGKIAETVESDNKIETTIGIPTFFNMKFSEDPDVMKTTNTLSQLESGKELIEKVFHDNAFLHFINYLETNNLLFDINESSIDDYVKFTGEYKLLDLDSILSVYSDEFIEFLADSAGMNASSDAIRKKKVNEEKKAQKNIRRIMNIAKTMLPTSKFISCNNCFIPIDSKYLRESSNAIRFNYTGTLTIIGKYTSTVEKSVTKNIDEKSSFGKVFTSIDETTKVFYNSTLEIPLTDKVIIPIALYFE